MSSAQNAPCTEHWLERADGTSIFARHWRPAGPPRATLVICHGVNSHGGQYLRSGEEFAAAGFAVTALDLRGRGRSEGRRFYVEHVGQYAADVGLAVDYAAARDPGLPIFLLGHSAGGVTAVSYALDHQERLAGLVCESFAFRVFAPDFVLTLMKWLSHMVPRLPVLKLKMADFSRDPQWVAQLLADPLTLGEAQPVATVAALARAGDRFERDFASITLPVLIMHGTADKATRPDGSRQFFEQAGSADKQLILYDDYYHDLLNDMGRQRPMADIIGWIEARLSAGERGGPLVA